MRERRPCCFFDAVVSYICIICSGDEEVSSLHPATIKADRLESELEESRMLREKDRLRYEVKLQEAERDTGKLLRQVMVICGGFVDGHVICTPQSTLRSFMSPDFALCGSVVRHPAVVFTG